MSFVVGLALAAPALLAAAQNPERSMKIKNECSSTAYIYAVSGSAGECAAGCPEGSSCEDETGLCFWDNQTPSLGDWSVPSGQTTTITYPAIAGNVTWSGNYAFGLEGTTLSADEATCKSEGCRSNGPYNQAEFTMLYNSVDWYDISNIGGVNVPMSITPDEMDETSGDGYYCADLGAPVPKKKGLGKSSWAFEPPSDAYNWVSGGSGAECSKSSDCGDGESCGNVFADGAWNMVCGKLSGYWTENAVCAFGQDAGIFECNAEIENGSAGVTTLGQMQGCSGTSGSCYQPEADEACCGGVAWHGLGDLVVPGSHEPFARNPVWMKHIHHTLRWLKKGAGNSYTYPYDDMTSTSTCQKTGDNGLNVQGYTITLCPSGTSVTEVPSSPAPARRHTGMRRL